MTERHLDADRFSALAHRADSLSAEESAHLARCPECRDERDMIAAAARLGSAAVRGFNAARVTAAVLARRPAANRFPGRPAHWLIGLAAAAVLVVAVWPAGKGSPGGPDDPATASASPVLHELDDLTATQLEVVLQALPSQSSTISVIEDVRLGDMSANDLERVLQAMEE